MTSDRAHAYPSRRPGPLAGLRVTERSVTVDFRPDQGREFVRDSVRTCSPGTAVVLTNAEGRAGLSSELLQAACPDRTRVQVHEEFDGSPAVGYAVNGEVGSPFVTGPQGRADPVDHVLHDVALVMADKPSFLAEAQVNQVDRERIGNYLYRGSARDFTCRDASRARCPASSAVVSGGRTRCSGDWCRHRPRSRRDPELGDTERTALFDDHVVGQ